MSKMLVPYSDSDTDSVTSELSDTWYDIDTGDSDSELSETWYDVDTEDSEDEWEVANELQEGMVSLTFAKTICILHEMK